MYGSFSVLLAKVKVARTPEIGIDKDAGCCRKRKKLPPSSPRGTRGRECACFWVAPCWYGCVDSGEKKLFFINSNHPKHVLRPTGFLTLAKRFKPPTNQSKAPTHLVSNTMERIIVSNNTNNNTAIPTAGVTRGLTGRSIVSYGYLGFFRPFCQSSPLHALVLVLGLEEAKVTRIEFSLELSVVFIAASSRTDGRKFGEVFYFVSKGQVLRWCVQSHVY